MDLKSIRSELLDLQARNQRTISSLAEAMKRAEHTNGLFSLNIERIDRAIELVPCFEQAEKARMEHSTKSSREETS